jgi:hypothetical protein
MLARGAIGILHCDGRSRQPYPSQSTNHRLRNTAMTNKNGWAKSHRHGTWLHMLQTGIAA